MHTPLIATLSMGLVLALLLGAVSQRLRMSPLVGYLLAGICVGPYTPLFVAHKDLSHEISEIGVILLMFGVGLHFSIKDLMSVKHIAIPGAICQIIVATLMGIGLCWGLGWPIGAGLVFGLALSVASTVVLLRALESRQLIDSRRGKIAIGWLIVEDLIMVLTLVLLPTLASVLGEGTLILDAGSTDLTDVAITAVTSINPSQLGVFHQLIITLIKVIAFIVLMLLVGRRIIPWLLEFIASMGSRELFTLTVLAIAMGIAFGASELFSVSFALGAFFAGMVLNESELSHKAAEDSLPFRDAFAVLFFVAVGMLFDPKILLNQPIIVLITFLIIVIGKSIAAFIIVKAFGKNTSTALTVSISLAQIGEFSFILAGLGMTYHLLPKEGYDLILAGAILSILVNPLLFVLLDRIQPLLNSKQNACTKNTLAATQTVSIDETSINKEENIENQAINNISHIVIIGYSQVGCLLCNYLYAQNISFIVIEASHTRAAKARARGYKVVEGNATNRNILQKANITQAKWLLITIQNSLEAGQIIEHTVTSQIKLNVLVQAKSDAEQIYLEKHGANHLVRTDIEIAKMMETRIIS